MYAILSKLYKTIFLVLLGALLFTSCASKQDVLYLQDISRLDSINSSVRYTTKISPNDLLAITVTAENMAAVQPFNLPLSTVRDVNETTPTNRISQPYMVSPQGTINFPKLGIIDVAGQTRQEVIKLLTDKLSKYVIDPRVDVRIQNFKITVLGAVSNPGTYAIKDERVTILEALGLAGDMTIYGERDSVLVLREQEGVKRYGRIDLRQSDFLDSPYYYLKQNDVVIVEQNKAEVQKSISNPNTGIYFSVASLLLSVLIILTR